MRVPYGLVRTRQWIRAYEAGHTAGRAHRADWLGPLGDGSLGSLSLDFVGRQTAPDAAWGSDTARWTPWQRRAFERGFLSGFVR